MFLFIMLAFMLVGTILTFIDYISIAVGMPMLPIVSMGYKTIGVILFWIGPMLYVGRLYMTGATHFTPLANPKQTILIHVGKSNAKILRGKKEEPNRIRAKGVGRSSYMNIKDMGQGLNVAGHDLVITTQDDGHNLPLWICDAVSKWKARYGISTEREFKMLYDKIKNIQTYNDLYDIDMLKPIMNDPDKKHLVLDLSLDDLRNMRELLYDGKSIDVKAYLNWSEDATPYDNETIIDSTISHRRAQDISYRSMGGVDWAKWIIPISIIFIMGAIAYQIFGS